MLDWADNQFPSKDPLACTSFPVEYLTCTYSFEKHTTLDLRLLFGRKNNSDFQGLCLSFGECP